MKIIKNVNYIKSGMTSMGRQMDAEFLRKDVNIVLKVNDEELKKLSTIEGFKCYLDDEEEIEIDINLDKYYLTFIGNSEELWLDYIKTDTRNDIRLTEEIADEIVNKILAK